MAKNTVWHTEYSAWSLEALVEEINRLNYWELEACKELCKRAGLESDWEMLMQILLRKSSIMLLKFSV